MTIADLIGDLDPIKAATLRLDYSDERVIHYGIIPRTNRGIFAINELPDLQPRIQVGLLNILEEKDFQIRGFPVRMPLDVVMVFSAVLMSMFYASCTDTCPLLIAALVTAFLLAGLFFVMNYGSLAVEVIFGTLTLWLQVETIKVLTDRARPFLDLEETRVIGWRERGRSFPSGHTAQTFFLMTLLSHRFQLGIGGTVALYAVAGLVGFTRIFDIYDDAVEAVGSF